MISRTTIKIHDQKNGQINPLFIRANGIILEKHLHRINKQPTDQLKNKELRYLWKKEFNAHLVCDRKLKIFKQIKFKNAADYMVFLMKLTG
jgi:hypothetical protein